MIKEKNLYDFIETNIVQFKLLKNYNFYFLDIVISNNFSKKILIFYIVIVTNNLSGTNSYK